MSGHNKWASIKHKKAAADAKRGKVFTKVIREITLAARNGGGDAETNPSLRMAIMKAKEANMPSENITRAIKRGTGELEGQTYEEQMYEGYGPGKVAVIIRVLSDNKNRSSSDIRQIFNKRSYSMAAPGAVSYMFKRKGYIEIPLDAIAEDDLFMMVTDAGAEDIQKESDHYEVTSLVESFESVRKALEKANIKYTKAEITYIPDTLAPVNDVEIAKKLHEFLEALDENDDVQDVFDNSDIPESVLAQL